MALIHLRKNTGVTEFRIKIPDPGFNVAKNLQCQISGYGATRNLGLSSLTLKAGYTGIISKEECASMMSVLLSNSSICSKNRGTAPCGGDSGGPLICSENLLGVISHGPACDKKGLPSVYSFTPLYKEWIRKVASSYKALKKSS